MPSDPTPIVPDMVGAVVAWRAWKIGADGLLHSVSMTDVAWRPREAIQAACSKRSAPHEPPGEDCDCGIYAAKTREHLESMHYPNYNYQLGDPSVCVGEVWLWGGIVPGSQGWRAQFAYPKRLLVPHEAYLAVADLRALYGVPVKLENTLRRAAA